MKWKERTLGSCASFQSGGTPDKSRADFWDGDIPWVSSGEMSSPFISDTTLKISVEAATKGSKIVPAKTVLVVVRGMSLAKEFRVALTEREVAFNQDLKALRCVEDVDPTFLFYALRSQSNFIKDLATESSHGTKKLESSVLSAINLNMPGVDIQGRVVAVIKPYDDLIENNGRRIQLLEEAARLLYREWFVHFRFPGHEHVQMIDGLPEGWKRTPLEKLTKYLSRGISPQYDEDGHSIVVNQKCIRNRFLSLGPARRQSKPFVDPKSLQLFDVLINSTGTGTLGRVAQCWFSRQAITFDSHVTVARALATVDVCWFGYALLELEKLFENMGTGATNQKELAKSDIAAVPVIEPPLSLQQTFGQVVKESSRQQQLLTEQNINLAQARDLLLPRLMSGELAV